MEMRVWTGRVLFFEATVANSAESPWVRRFKCLELHSSKHLLQSPSRQVTVCIRVNHPHEGSGEPLDGKFLREWLRVNHPHEGSGDRRGGHV